VSIHVLGEICMKAQESIIITDLFLFIIVYVCINLFVYIPLRFQFSSMTILMFVSINILGRHVL